MRDTLMFSILPGLLLHRTSEGKEKQKRKRKQKFPQLTQEHQEQHISIKCLAFPYYSVLKVLSRCPTGWPPHVGLNPENTLTLQSPRQQTETPPTTQPMRRLLLCFDSLLLVLIQRK